MRRALATLAAAATLLALGACSAPASNPCLYDGGLRTSHLSYNGRTLLLVCHDGKVIVRHP